MPTPPVPPSGPARRPAGPRERPSHPLPRRPPRDARGRRGARHPRRHRELGQRGGPRAPDRGAHQGPRRPLPHPALLRPPGLPARPRRGPGGGRGGRALLHRPPARPRRRRRPDGHRLARARLPALLPGLQEGPAGRRAAPPLRLHGRRPHRVRGRAPDRPRRGGAGTSKLLQQEIERPRVGPMRDIVATIQPEQDEIVRSGLGGTVCVQGGPGTGKTAVGLHRVAYLLYAHRERLARTGTLVIGPNRPSSTTSSKCCPRWASWRSSRPRSTTWSRMWRCAARTSAAAARSSRATPGWRRCCAGPCART